MDNIELRSEKARNIIGKIPPAIVRNGISVLAMVFLTLVVSSYYFPYTETVSAPVQVIHNSHFYYGIATLPISLQSKIVQGESVMIEIEGYGKNKYGQLKGNIGRRDSIPRMINGEKQIRIQIPLGTSLTLSSGSLLNYYSGMEGTATIFLKKERLLKVLFAWARK